MDALVAALDVVLTPVNILWIALGVTLGYVVGVTLSTVVDLFWFPTAGHHVHGW